ncbi:MAG: PKD domain-containing protein [Sulfurimonadaceae bacterium]
MIYKTLLLLLIFMLDLNAESRVTSKDAYVALESKLACAVNEKEAIIKVDATLEETTGVHSKHLYSKNVYIRHEKNGKGEFCVEGVITKKGFDLYAAELEEEYESIMGDIEDLNDGISYVQKQREVEHLYSDVNSYNQKIDVAQKIAPLKVERIAETKVSLSKIINAVPVVKFKVNGCKGKYMTGCRLVFVSSLQDDSSTVLYRWDFGDGSHSRLTNPIHYYKQPGRYKVSLRITDGGNKQTEVTQELHVSAQPKPKLKHKPSASFSTHKKVYVSGEPIEFIDLSTSEESKVTGYKWSFGDGGNSKLCNPKYSYSKTGTYKVHLEITNSDGLRSDVVENVQIVHPAILFGIDGCKFNRVVRKFGQPKQSVIKSGTLTQAHQYGSDWLLVKQNKVECRIKGSAFKTNLMGNPKNCHWYEKHAISAMYVLGQ